MLFFYHAVHVTILSVRLSVSLSPSHFHLWTVLKRLASSNFLPSVSVTILFFSRQTAWRNSDERRISCCQSRRRISFHPDAGHQTLRALFRWTASFGRSCRKRLVIHLAHQVQLQWHNSMVNKQGQQGSNQHLQLPIHTQTDKYTNIQTATKRRWWPLRAYVWRTRPACYRYCSQAMARSSSTCQGKRRPVWTQSRINLTNLSFLTTAFYSFRLNTTFDMIAWNYRAPSLLDSVSLS